MLTETNTNYFLLRAGRCLAREIIKKANWAMGVLIGVRRRFGYWVFWERRGLLPQEENFPEGISTDFQPMLGYKKLRTRTKVNIADRWLSSSQIHHGCGCRLIAPTKLAKKLISAVTGEEVDRDRNAALNLRDYDPEELYVSTNPVDFTPDKLCFFVNPVNWPDLASCGSVEATAPVDTRADQGGKSLVGTDPGSDVGVPNAGGVAVRLLPRMEQAAVRPEPNRRQGLRGGTPQGVSTR